MGRTAIQFFGGIGSQSPTASFLKSLSKRQQTKVKRQLRYLQEFGLTPAIPNCKKIRSTEIWELRILGRDNIRIFCASVEKNKVVVLHIFFNKTKKTAVKEVRLAVSRLNELVC